MVTSKLIERIKLDILRIRETNDRTTSLAEQPLRWEGIPPNPNGWRLLGDLADDLEVIVEHLLKNIDDLK